MRDLLVRSRGGDLCRKQWLELMSWLDGDGPFEQDEFDVVLEALVDLVTKLLNAHPTWG